MICPFGTTSEIKNIANLFIYFLFNKAFLLNNWQTVESLVSNSTVHSLEGSLIQMVVCLLHERMLHEYKLKREPVKKPIYIGFSHVMTDTKQRQT